MSGHSKWSKVKHQKATTDVLKAAAFTKASRAITVAVVEGGGMTDPEFNFKLRLAIEKAKQVNMPGENIKRAIDKASGAGAGTLKQETYEGYGPFGVALFIETATDNTNRTVSFIKQTLEHAGGSMGSPGSVVYLFERKGVVLLAKTRTYDDTFAYGANAGADDVIETDDVFEVYCDPAAVSALGTAAAREGFTVEESRVIMRPTMTVPLDDQKRSIIESLVEKLEEHDDIQEVFTTMA